MRHFVSPRARTLVILNVYAYGFCLGMHSPGSVESFLFVAYAWQEDSITLRPC